MKSCQYAGSSASLLNKPEKLGVLCTWYKKTKDTSTFSLEACGASDVVHSSYPLESYLCKLPKSCFQEDAGVGNDKEIANTIQ